MLIVASPCAATPIFFENFDSVAVGSYSSPAVVGNFINTSGSVEVVGPGYFPELCVSPESGSCLDLDGLSNGTIQTAPFVLQPGTNYTLSFDLNGSQRDTETSTTVTFGSYSETFFRTFFETPSPIVRLITVGSVTSAPLVFKSNSGDYAGALLDNVSIDAVNPAAVPEPSTMTLLALGLASAVKARRRRRQSEPTEIKRVG